jgi:hypothetical protein
MGKLVLTFGLVICGAGLGAGLVYQAGSTITSQTVMSPSHPATHRIVNRSGR